MPAPTLVKQIPPQVINERASFGPVNLSEYIQVPAGSEAPRFTAEIQGGAALPTGMICTSDGMLTGIPAKDTIGSYMVLITAANSEGSMQAQFIMTIKPSLVSREIDFIDKLKAQVWEALEKRLPAPELAELYERPITELDIYHLLERWGTLTVWDAFNLEPPGEKQLLTLPDNSSHYDIWDRGSCLVAAPKDLYNYERTLEDGLLAARALAREVYRRGWTMEIAGFEKYTRAAWVELQHLADQYGRRLEVINFSPSPDDVKLYRAEAMSMNMRRNEGSS